MKRILSKRENWEEMEASNSLFNLKWQQTSLGYRFERLSGNQSLKQMVNHFEFHKEITTKNGLIKSLSSYCEVSLEFLNSLLISSQANKIYLFDVTPLTFAFDMDDEAGFDIDMQNFTKFFIKNCGDPKKYASNDQCTVKKNSPNVLFTYEFKRKGKTLHVMQNSNEDKKLSPYLKPKLANTYYGGVNMWLLKPTGLNRGRGIELFNTLEELNKYINQYLEGESIPRRKNQKGGGESGAESSSDEESKQNKKGPPGAKIRSHTFVIQKYIERPLLVNERKFDIRAYALVTHEMQLYFFK